MGAETSESFFTSAGSLAALAPDVPMADGQSERPTPGVPVRYRCWLTQQSAALPELPPTGQAVLDTRTNRRRDRMFVRVRCG